LKIKRKLGIAIIILSILLTIGTACIFYIAYVTALLFCFLFKMKADFTDFITKAIIAAALLLSLFYLGISLVKKPRQIKP
jgi:hypothetical protein